MTLPAPCVPPWCPHRAALAVNTSERHWLPAACGDSELGWYPLRSQPGSQQAELIQPAPVSSRHAAAALGVQVVCLGLVFFPFRKSSQSGTAFPALLHLLRLITAMSLQTSSFPQRQQNKGFQRRAECSKEAAEKFQPLGSKFQGRYRHTDAQVDVGLWRAEASGKRVRRDALTERTHHNY